MSLGSADPSQDALECPACDVPMLIQALDMELGAARYGYRGWETRAPVCPRCRGVWLTASHLAELVAAEAARAHARSSRDVVRRNLVMSVEIIYRSCPVCSERMRRRNFRVYSGVVVHECGCGTFFEHGDLAAVLTFIRTGGLELQTPRYEYGPPPPRKPTPSDVPRALVHPLRGATQRLRASEGEGFVRAFARWLLDAIIRSCARVVFLLREALRARTSRPRRR